MNILKGLCDTVLPRRDVQDNVLPKFIKLSMEMPYVYDVSVPFRGTKYMYMCGCWKLTEKSVFEFYFKYMNNSLLGELIEIKVIFILRQQMFRSMQKSQKISCNVFNPCKSLLGHHAANSSLWKRVIAWDPN